MPRAHATIPRHKTAIRRGDLSRPIRSALDSRMIDPATTVFDYGCGHGQDMALLASKVVDCAGCDSVFCPDRPQRAADVVNLGYVINVIEDPAERAGTLRQAGSSTGDPVVDDYFKGCLE
jgi:DNA phosphorothioation-associated putative methyltransferase